MKLTIISCNVMSHELRFCAARSPNPIDIRFLHQGLHEFPGRLNAGVLAALDEVEEGSCDYVLLNYGLCGNGTLEISHKKLPLIIHNIHDCIAVILGDEHRYREYVEERPGTFWFSVGWIEGFPLPGSPDYQDHYREFYGSEIDEQRRDLLERIMMENYTHLAYIRWDCLGERLNRAGSAYTRACVRSLNERLGMNMRFDELAGDPSRLQRFVDGEWEGPEFLLVEPGQHVRLDYLKCKLLAEQ